MKRNIFFSVYVAMKGIERLLVERNFFIEVVAIMFSIFFGILFQLEVNEWLLSLAFSAMLLLAEGMNTAIENLSDMQKILGLDYDSAGQCRDIASGLSLIHI